MLLICILIDQKFWSFPSEDMSGLTLYLFSNVQVHYKDSQCNMCLKLVISLFLQFCLLKNDTHHHFKKRVIVTS